MWLLKRRHPLMVIAVASALLVATVLGSDRAMTALAGALMATIALALFELYGLPTR